MDNTNKIMRTPKRNSIQAAKKKIGGSELVGAIRVGGPEQNQWISTPPQATKNQELTGPMQCHNAFAGMWDPGCMLLPPANSAAVILAANLHPGQNNTAQQNNICWDMWASKMCLRN